MNFKELQIALNQHMLKLGFSKGLKGNYLLDCEDKVTTLVCQIPNGIRGFLIGMQFKDFGIYNGLRKDSHVKQYDLENELAFANTVEYFESDLLSAVEKLKNFIKKYKDGKNALRANLNDWVIGVDDERLEDQILRYLNLPGIDPYSIEYLKKTLKDFSRNHGFISMSQNEYEEHRNFYDLYKEYGGVISLNIETARITISFPHVPKWYQI